MARDLIPPSSPAGRPLPDGAPRLIELPPEPPRSGSQPAMSSAPTGPSQFRNRFGFLLGSLAGVCVAAVLVVVAILATNGGSSDTAGLAKNWSKWKPDDTTLQGGTAEIAKKVGAEYKQGNGKQLVLVEPNPVDNLHVALSPSSGNIAQINGTGVVYNLNGLGANGSILGGKPSPARLQVIQREALELALYTFRYLPDVDMVVTFLPPPPDSSTDSASSSSASSLLGQSADPATQTALFYRPGDLKQYLQIPLGATVPSNTPTPDTLDATEGKRILSLTDTNKFEWSLQPNSGLLVLNRPS